MLDGALHLTEVYSEPIQTSRMQRFVKTELTKLICRGLMIKYIYWMMVLKQYRMDIKLLIVLIELMRY